MVFNRYISIFLLRAKAGLMSRMLHPLNFLVMVVTVALQGFLTILFVKVIYNYTGSISGWTYNEAMMVVASFLLIEGLIWFTTAQFAGIRKNIKSGSFDHILIKPIKTLFLVSVWRVDVEDVMRVIVALFIFSQVVGSFHFTLLGWVVRTAFYVLTIICGYVISYSLALIVNSLFFWYTEANGINMMLESITRMGQYPTGILYGNAVKFILSFILPITFLGTVPATIFTDDNYVRAFLLSLMVATICFGVALKVFNAGLKAYSSASS